MSTNTGLVVGAVVLGGGILLYAMTSSQKKLLASTNPGNIAGVGGLLTGLGTFVKDIGGGSGPSGGPPAAYSKTSTPNNNNSSPISSDSSGFGITPTEQGNVDSYDAQSGDVYGIAGIDF
jgi:hypothetical protein